MDSDCQAIKTKFAGAANSLSEFFMGSVNLQKKAYCQGKKDAFREIAEFCNTLETDGAQKIDGNALKLFIER